MSRRYPSFVPHFTVGISLFLLSSLSGAANNVFRCTSPDGRVEFRQQPCSSGVQESVEIEDVRVGWEAPPPPKQKKRESKVENRSARQAAKAARAAKREKEKKELECWKREKKLEDLQWRLRRGYKASQGPKLRRKRDEYEEFLRKFC